MPSPYIEYLTESDFEQWDKFVDTSEQGSIYSKSYYLDALSKAAGARFRILAIRKGQEIFGGIGLFYHEARYGFEVQRASLLYYNGIVLKNFGTKYPSKETQRHLKHMRMIIHEIGTDPYAVVTLSNRATLTDIRPFAWDGWQMWPQYTYEASISDMDQLWDQTEQNLRRLITRCEKEGMRLEINEDFDTFYTLHKSTFAQKNLPPYYSYEGFKNVYETLRAHNNVQLYFIVTGDGEPVATQMVLFTDHPVTHTCAAATHEDHLQSGVSALLRWKVFQDLNKRGYAANDLTDAMLETVAKFKAQLGARLLFCPMLHRVNSSAMRRNAKIKNNLVRPMSAILGKVKSSVSQSSSNAPQANDDDQDN